MKNFESILVNYLKRDTSKNNYALLLNGKWGVGKTYYLKNTIIPFVNKIDIPNDGKTQSWQVIYVSLNGLSTIPEIIGKLRNEKAKYHLNSNDEIEKSIATKVHLSPFIEYAKVYLEDGGNKEKTYAEKLAVLENYDNFLVCFDDLERCAIPIKEVFGFINSHLVEHYGIKTLIIANEEAILKTLATDAAKSGYLDIKEKVIGRTVLFERTQREIITTVASQNKYEQLLAPLNHYICSKISFILDDNKIWNLRTLFFAFEMIEEILTECKIEDKAEFEEPWKTISEKIIFYALCLAYAYKENNKLFGELKKLRSIDPSFDEKTPEPIDKYKKYFFHGEYNRKYFDEMWEPIAYYVENEYFNINFSEIVTNIK